MLRFAAALIGALPGNLSGNLPGALPGILLGLILLISPDSASAQDGPPADSIWTVEMPVMVVTATRTEQSIRNTPVPTRIVRSEDIRRRGSLRLSDLLSEEPGLMLVHDHGTGLQIQGFDADYTLFLIDGQPVIGRTAGTLDLDRIPVEGIERVEVVQGPSSSLYGSEALAGVVNIITQRPADAVTLGGGVRRQSFGTTDLNGSISLGRGRFGGRASYNRLSTDGYDLSPDVAGLTGPAYTSQTASTRLDWNRGGRLDAFLALRYARQDQSNTIGLVGSEGGSDRAGESADGVQFEEDGLREDWSIGPEATLRLTPAHRLQLRGYASGFRTRSTLTPAATGPGDGTAEGASDARFRQGLSRIEAQYDFLGSAHHLITGGTGYTRETVTADRILGGSRNMGNMHAFLQHQWARFDVVQTTLSARLDAHTEYDTRLSPKVAVLVKPTESLHIQASVGTGFKAPTFQQLYMDFTNPVAGYSVIGAADAVAALDSLDAIGQVAARLGDVNTAGGVRPEESLSFNAGVRWTVTPRVWLSVSAFRNHVSDLIETLPVATKPNGQSIFTYVNLSRIRTQGVVADLRIRPVRSLTLRAGYQLLRTADLDVLDGIDAGTVFTRENGVDRRITRAEYGGLFNRSRHSGTLAATYVRPESDLSISIRTQYRGRYGFGDMNGNLILDADSEYVPSYWHWHVTATRPVGRLLTAQAGVRNLFDHTDEALIPSIPGRQIFAGLSVKLQP